MNTNEREKFRKAYIAGDKARIRNILKKETPISLIKFCNGSYCENGNVYLDSLKTNKLWLSSPRLFNDPFDCALNNDYEQILDIPFRNLSNLIFQDKTDEILENSNYEKIREEKANEVRKVLEQRDNEIKNNVFISCFSEISNLTSLLMWGHYSNCHKGFCIEYKIEERDINLSFPRYLMPVIYKNKYNIKDDEIHSDSEAREFVYDISFTKSSAWKYEKEWRFLEGNEYMSGRIGYHINFPKPVGIYMGCKIEDRLKLELKSIAAMQNISIYQMEIKPGSFELINRKL